MGVNVAEDLNPSYSVPERTFFSAAPQLGLINDAGKMLYGALHDGQIVLLDSFIVILLPGPSPQFLFLPE